GASVMIMEEGLDTGPVLSQARTPISPSDNELTLTDRLATIGAELLVSTLPGWEAGSIQPQPQDESAATWTRPVTRADGAVDWAKPAIQLWREIRAYAAWPQSYTTWNGTAL